jgi:ribosome maturation factor RimP
MEPQIKAGVDLARVRAAVLPVLVAHGVELADVQFLTERAGWTLRLFIERPGSSEASGGVTLADCAEVSRDVSTVLDVADLIPHRYHLEVSSPGLDRPLRSREDFVRFRGKLARVKLNKPAPDGQRLLRGTIEEAPEGAVAMCVDDKRIEVAYADVEEANLVFELAPQPKQGKGKSGGAGRRRGGGKGQGAPSGGS